MAKGRSKMLGLAITPGEILLAELAAHQPLPRVVKLAVLPMRGGLSYEQPAAVGQALRQVLKAQGFTARDVVVGLPAKWLLSRKKDLPPAAQRSVCRPGSGPGRCGQRGAGRHLLRHSLRLSSRDCLGHRSLCPWHPPLGSTPREVALDMPVGPALRGRRQHRQAQ